MPRTNSTTRSVGDDISASRLNDINDDIDDLYLNWPDRLRVYRAISWTALRIDISAGAYYIWSTSGVYSWWTDIVVTDAVTNYVMIDSSWTITISTSARTAWLWRLAQVICSGGAVTSIILRNNMVFGGAAVDFTAMTEDASPDEENDFLYWYDTSAGLNKKVKPKNLDIRPFIEWTAGESITAWQAVRYANYAPGETIWQWVWTNNNSLFAYNTTNQSVWQSFTLTVWWLLTSITVNMKKVASPTGNITCYVYADSDLSTILATSSNTISAAWLTTSYTSNQFNFASQYLVAWVYRFRISSSGANSTTNYLHVWDTTNTYAGGTAFDINSTPTRTAAWSRDLWFTLVTASNGETSWRIYKTSASFSYQVGFIWFARQTVSAAATLQVDTTLTKNQSWLTPLSDYYLWNTAWTISTSAWTVSKKIWKALSATELAVEYNPA